MEATAYIAHPRANGAHSLGCRASCKFTAPPNRHERRQTRSRRKDHLERSAGRALQADRARGRAEIVVGHRLAPIQAFEMLGGLNS